MIEVPDEESLHPWGEGGSGHYYYTGVVIPGFHTKITHFSWKNDCFHPRLRVPGKMTDFLLCPLISDFIGKSPTLFSHDKIRSQPYTPKSRPSYDKLANAGFNLILLLRNYGTPVNRL